jgi:long-chain acyl-CoA synthetase/crotonobetaine/carnitine-CoA ligase
VPVPDPDRKEEVKAYIVPAQGESSDTIPPLEIIEFCEERLADFKVPRYIEYRDRDFERTPTGKIQKLKILSEKEDLTADCFDRMAK